MVKEHLKRIIVENQERMPFPLFSRLTPTLTGTRQIHAVIGLRRVGKTHFLYQIANELLVQGVAKERILLVNFEDERLAGLATEKLGLVLDAHKERELRGLVAAMSAFGLSTGTVITAEKDEPAILDGKTVTSVPLWRWLLNV